MSKHNYPVKGNSIIKVILFLLITLFGIPFIINPAYAANNAPTVGTITPNSGSSHYNTAVTFNTTYNDLDGWQDITYIHFLINRTINAKNGFYAQYDRANNLLYLRDDNNTAWSVGYAPGSNNIIENSYARLDCSQTTISGSGTTITARWNVTFKSTFNGAKNTCLAVRDTSNAFSTWQIAGTWTIDNDTPAIGTITPSSGKSAPNAAVTFTTTYNDLDGWWDITYIYFIINATLNGTNGFYAQYDRVNNLLYLRDDNNTAWLGGFAPGSNNIIENSYARLDCNNTTITGSGYSGTTITAKWRTVFKDTFRGAKNTYLAARDTSNGFSAWHTAGTWTVNRTPTVGTITPISGKSNSNVAVTFTTTYNDLDGWQDITYINFLINKTLNSTNGFYAQYDRKNNLLYLRNDNNTAWLGGYAPGSSNIIENSYAKLDCSSSYITGSGPSGTTMTANWRVIFKNTFDGAKNTYLAVWDNSNAFSAWQTIGTWTIDNDRPTVGPITPNSGNSDPDTAVTFTTTYTDLDGWWDISYIYFIINTTINGTNGFYAQYDCKNNLLHLRNDNNTAWSVGYAPGSNNIIENSYARLDCSQTTITGSGSSGTTITARWRIEFKGIFKGAKNTCLAARDTSNSFSAWHIVGTWNINNNAPTVGTIIPSSGNSNSNTAVTFNTTYTDLNGWQDIGYIYFLVNRTLNAKNGFYAQYDRVNNLLYLRDDNNTAWSVGYAPGSNNIIENSYARLDCSQTTISGSGTTITARWNVTFKSTFDGAKNTCLAVRDISNSFSAWHIVGTWTIDNNAPTVGTIIPSSGSSNPNAMVTITTTYNDLDGWQDITYINFLINKTLNGTNGFYAQYDRVNNLLYMRDDNNTAWLGGFAPGTSNIIENSYARLDCSQTTISGSGSSGTTITAVWRVAFKNSLNGTLSTCLAVRDTSNAFSAWHIVGTWTINNTLPTAIITSPTNNQEVYDTVTITGTATDPYFSSYTVEYGSGTSPSSWTTITTSTTAVTSGTLASWDTHALGVVNGTYTLRLTTTDTSNVSATATVIVDLNSINITNISVTPTFISSELNESATISYTINKQATVTVNILQEDNTLVKTVFAGSQSAGNQSVIWDGKDAGSTNIPSGVYKYTIKAEATVNNSQDEYAPTTTISPSASLGNWDRSFNPYRNEKCTINYTVNSVSKIRINLSYINMDLINNKPHQPGSYQYLWDGRRADGSIYQGSYMAYLYTAAMPVNYIVVDNDIPLLDAVSAEAYLISPVYDQVSTIYYTLLRNADVTITIYDPNGSYFATLTANTAQTAGQQTIEWPGTAQNGGLVTLEGNYDVKIEAVISGTTISDTKWANIKAYK